MDNERKVELFDSLLNWVIEHTEMHGEDAVCYALSRCGFNEFEIDEALAEIEFD